MAHLIKIVFFTLITGNLDIEYNFNIPLIISLDMKPEIGLNNNYNDDLDIALSIR
ncbi:hypothetical protein [Tenacibaculum aestuariivivum]|uniref:hypothetical protein n=1 Tax=Tenacibaculum aestuariivivum TaxID=2006131 RepID=UPI003AB591FB